MSPHKSSKPYAYLIVFFLSGSTVRCMLPNLYWPPGFDSRLSHQVLGNYWPIFNWWYSVSSIWPNFSKSVSSSSSSYMNFKKTKDGLLGSNYIVSIDDSLIILSSPNFDGSNFSVLKRIRRVSDELRYSNYASGSVLHYSLNDTSFSSISLWR